LNHLGDYNFDGFPDLIATVSKNKHSEIMFFQSISCDSSICTDAELKAGRRKFRSDFPEVKLEDTKEVVMGAFIDIDEAVRL
jgi:hypothetical protein